jgi:hypothetical protein
MAVQQLAKKQNREDIGYVAERESCLWYRGILTRTIYARAGMDKGRGRCILDEGPDGYQE